MLSLKREIMFDVSYFRSILKYKFPVYNYTLIRTLKDGKRYAMWALENHSYLEMKAFY